MSYWYSHGGKKHIAVWLSMIPVSLWSGNLMIAGSYAAGALATLSRTLDDWIFVEADAAAQEIHPFVFEYFEPGCITWLGFSTCEEVQFEEWKTLFNSPKKVSIWLFNVSNPEEIKKGSKPEMTETEPLQLIEEHQDLGSSAGAGIFTLKARKSTKSSSTPWNVNLVTPNLARQTSLSNSASSTGDLFPSVQVGSLLGHPGFPPPTSGMSFYTMDSDINWKLQSGVRFGVKGLMHFSIVEDDSFKCSVDPDCSAHCHWGLTCEPLTYGYTGLVLPASLFREGWAISPYSQWPRWKWDWKKYLPKSATYLTHLAAPVLVFNPNSFVTYIFHNTADATLESYPDVEFQKWKATGFSLRNEGCSPSKNPSYLLVDQYPYFEYNLKSSRNAGSLGMDCGGYPEFVSTEFVKKGLFVSQPHFQTLDESGDPKPPAPCASRPYLPCISKVSGSPPAPQITTQLQLGLRMDFEESWQLNVLIPKGTTPYSTDMFYPLFWTRSRPKSSVLDMFEFPQAGSNRFNFGIKSFKNYGNLAGAFLTVGIFVYIVCLFILILQFLYASTCFSYMKRADAAYEVEAPKYVTF